jgi:hypothetical protein
MAEFKVTRRFAEHRGGTKAYQIFEVQCETNVAIVLQYGKFSTGSDPVSMGGSVSIEGVYGQRQARGVADRKQTEKMRRGYDGWTEDTFTAADEASFKDVLKKLWGDRKAEQVFARVSKGMVTASTDPQPSEPPPEVDPENDDEGDTKAPVIEIEQSSPEWGSW